MIKIFLSFIISFSFTTFIFGNKLVFPDIEGYTKTLREDVYYPDNLYDLINGGSDAYIEYDFIDLHLCEYKKEDITITVEAYNHGNLSNAFGIYSSERSADYHFIEMGAEGYQEDGILNFFQGQYYIKINGFSENGKDVNSLLPEIAGSVSTAISEEKNVPEIFKKFPLIDKIPYSEGYVNNHYLGYSFLNNVFLAKYNLMNIEITLFVVINENEEKARESLSAYLIKMNIPADKHEKGIYTLQDPYAGKIFLQTSGNFLLGTLHCEDIEAAGKIFSAFH